MKTIYKVTVEHKDDFNPDNVVEIAEYILQHTIETAEDFKPEFFLHNVIIKAGALSKQQIEATDILKREQIIEYGKNIKELAALSILALTILTRRENDIQKPDNQ